MLQKVSGQATSQRWYCLPSTQARTGMCRMALRLRGRFRRLPPVLKPRLSHAQSRKSRNRRECCKTGPRESLYNLRTIIAAQRRWFLLVEHQLIENRQSSCVAFRPGLPGSEGHKMIRWLFSRYLPLPGVGKTVGIAMNWPLHPWIPACAGMTEWGRQRALMSDMVSEQACHTMPAMLSQVQLRKSQMKYLPLPACPPPPT